MFKILKNQKATSTDLAETFVRAAELGKKLMAKKMEIHKKLMELQVDSFDRKPSKELLSLKTEMDALIIQLDACRFGQVQIKNRLGEVLQKEAALRLEEIKKELAAVSSEEERLQKEFLSSAAKAAVLRESIKGLTLSHDTKGNYQTSIPNLKAELHLMDLEDGQFYSDQVEHYRKELQVGDFSRSITGRRSLLTDEQTSLGKILAGNPLEEAQKLLDKLIPSASEPEVAELPKTHPSYDSKAFIRDYGEGQGPDYEDGPALPSKGINEVLRDRANS